MGKGRDKRRQKRKGRAPVVARAKEAAAIQQSPDDRRETRRWLSFAVRGAAWTFDVDFRDDRAEVRLGGEVLYSVPTIEVPLMEPDAALATAGIVAACEPADA